MGRGTPPSAKRVLVALGGEAKGECVNI